MARAAKPPPPASPSAPGERSEEAAELRSADGEAIAICRRLAGYTFPWDITRSLELALLKTFCVPSISGLLARSGEFGQRPRKRYDDTGLMVAELLRHGPASASGEAVIERMNRIHASFAISDHDYLYVLSTFVCEPIRWLARYGWRALHPEEEEALFRFWRLVGERMGIKAIPATLAELTAFNQDVEGRVFADAPTNREVANATRAMLLQEWPVPLQPLLAGVLTSLLNQAEAACLGWSTPPSALQALVLFGLRLRSRLAGTWQRLRPPQTSRFYSERPTPTYGPSFELQQLGPPQRLAQLNRPRWRGQQRRLGLTGGIATGKSAVGRLLEQEHGLPVLDADRYAREALAPGSPGARAVLERYGDRVRSQSQQIPGSAAAKAPERGLDRGPQGNPADSGPPEACIDRAALGRIVFSDPAERQWLEGLVHPLVRQRFEAELERLAVAPTVVLMVPLLFEAGLEQLCTDVWLVDCEEHQQLQRLMARDKLLEEEARARIAAQWPLERKRALVDRCIDNRGDAAALGATVAAALAAGLSP